MDLNQIKFLRALGARLREHRMARGMTQAKLAEKCGLDRTFIGSVERGERNVSILNLRLIAQVLADLFAEPTRSGRSD